MKDELKDEADQSAALDVRQCCGRTFGVFINGKCVTCGTPEPDARWNADIERVRAHYNALKASHDRLLATSKWLARFADALESQLASPEERTRKSEPIIESESAIAQAEALNEEK